MFKQVLQAEAIVFCQLDSCRLGGVNEVLAVLLLAAKFGIPVCPHAGGVGLCEYVQHLAIFDYTAVSGSLEDRVVEYVDHLHEHFFDPAMVRNGRYVAPTAPGYSITMRPGSLEPGDVIATGTPAGVGVFRQPPRFLGDGDEVAVEIDGIGRLTNTCRVIDG